MLMRHENPSYTLGRYTGYAPNGRREVTYPDLPYVAKCDHDGDYSWNCNNYVHGDMARIKPRGQQVAA